MYYPCSDLLTTWLLQNRFDVGDKTLNIAIQRVLQQCCKIGCRFFIARFSVKHESLRICWSPTLHKITATTHLYARSIKGLLFAHFLIGSVIGSYLLTTLKSWHATVSKIFWNSKLMDLWHNYFFAWPFDNRIKQMPHYWFSFEARTIGDERWSLLAIFKLPWQHHNLCQT